MNAQGIEVERTRASRSCPGLHGLWSVGLGLGAAAAALAAAAGLDPLPHFAIVAAVLALASFPLREACCPPNNRCARSTTGERPLPCTGRCRSRSSA